MAPSEKRLKPTLQELYGQDAWLFDHLFLGLGKWASKPIAHLTERCTGVELAFCLVVGFAASFTLANDFTRTIVTVLCLILTVAFISGVKAADHTLPIKTWFVDYPAHGLANLSGSDFLVTGGGGGLAYGVPDQSTVCRLANSKFDKVGGIPLNSFAQYNDRYYPALAETLKACELLMGESIPASVLWALSSYPPRRLLAGGSGGKLMVYRQKEEDYNSIISIVASHEIIRQSVKNKRRILLSRTRFSRSGEYLAVLTEDNKILVYSVPTFDDGSLTSQEAQLYNNVRASWQSENALILLGRVQISEKQVGCVVDVQITRDEQWVVALTASGSLLWLRIPRPLQGVNPESHRGYFRLMRSPETATPNLLALAETEAFSLSSTTQLPHSNDFYHRHLLCLDEHCSGPKQTIHRLVSFGIFRQHGYATTAAGCITGEWVCDGPNSSPVGRREGMRPRRIAGLDCVSACALSNKDDQIACISNAKIVTMDSKNLKVTRQIRRFDLASGETTLPATSVCWLTGDEYIAVGGADYSLSLIALHGDKASRTTAAGRWLQRMIRDSTKHALQKGRELIFATTLSCVTCLCLGRVLF